MVVASWRGLMNAAARKIATTQKKASKAWAVEASRAAEAWAAEARRAAAAAAAAAVAAAAEEEEEEEGRGEVDDGSKTGQKMNLKAEVTALHLSSSFRK